MEVPDSYLARIRERFPALMIVTARLRQDGLMNDVVIVNGDLVCRFAKTDGARPSLAHEAHVLRLVQRYVDLPAPIWECQEEDFVAYRLIPGIPLQRNDLLRLDERIQNRLAEQLATGLRQMYQIPASALAAENIQPSLAVRERRDWCQMYEDLQRELFPLLLTDAREWVRRQFEPVLHGTLSLAYEPVLIHGDLAPHHILYDPRAKRLTGIIDFGTAGLGDSATDYGCIIEWFGESYLSRMVYFYPDIATDVNRARFWAGTLELQWALAGLRTGDRSWFVNHIGTARDAGPLPG